ncbi:MAG: SprB repeat-containing protein [Bacteroidetes bacterium]|nr:SprB repeat-containing protein [Bacteroidota bacterium]
MNQFSTPSGNLITTKNFNFSSSYILVLAIFLCCFFQVTEVDAQCSYGGTAYCTVDASTLAFQQGPTQTPVSVVGTGCTCFYGGEYMPLTNVKAGEAFTIYTNSAAYDNQLTIFFEGDGTALAYQDDGGPWTQGVDRASISFVAPYSGDYRILNNVYNCATNVTCLDIRVAKIWPWGGGFGGATPPCSASYTSTNVGSGTYSYLNLTAGSNYTISTCGSSFNTQLTLYNYDGTNWRPFAYNGKNGSDCNGVNTGSVTFEAPTTSGANNYIAVVNRQTNESLNQNAYTAYNNYAPADQKWDDHDWSGVSAILKYRNNGVTTLTATSSGNVCSGATNGSVSLSLNGSCASNTLIAGQFERFNTSYTALNGYGGLWTYSGAGTAQTDVSGQAYFLNGNQNSWTNGFWANNTVTRSEGLTFYGRWYNTGTNSMVGWHDNTNGTSYTNLTYALYPYNSGGLAIYENGLYRGDVTSKAAGIIGLNKWIEFKIVLHNSGASYYVRNNLNGAAGSWTLVYYSTYSNAATLKAGAAHYYSGSAYFYMDDLFVGGMTQYPATSSLGAGTYDYMAQDGFGNVGLASATIGTFSTANNPGVISLTASTICTGGASTVNNVTAATTGSPASTGPLYNYYYMLNGGPTGTGGTWVGSGQSAATSWVVPSAVTTTVGSHTIARKSAFSCVAEVSAPFLNLVVVADPSAPTATASPNVATVCAGQTLTLTGVTDNGGGTGTCNIEYSANGGAYSTTLPSFTATVGTRTIAIRKNCNGSGCDLSSVNTYTWSVVADPIVNTQPVNASFCPGGTYSPSITASGGTPSLAYVWKYSTDNSSFNNCVNGTPVGSVYSNTTSSNTFSVAGITAAGTYYYRCFVSATGSNCDATQSNSGVLTVYPYPTFTTTPSNILCNGGTSGSILVNVTVGTSLFDYSKNAGGTYAGSSNQSSPYTFTGLTAGSYDIVVRDAHNCVSLPVSTIALSEPSSLPTLTETHTAVLCNGGSTGTITVTASGGTAGYNYSKDGGTNYQVSNVFSGLALGTYQIKVRDANLCTTANTSVSITQPAVLSFTSSKTDVVCFGDNNGTITLNGTGGVTPYQYSDDNGSSYNAGTDPYTFSSLPPATYLVGIRDANLCPTTFVSKVIAEPALLSFTTSQVDILCNGDNTGSITVSATGGTGTLVYSKNGGSSYQSSNIFSGLTAGTYSIKVKDANLCITAAQSVTINEPSSLPTLTETHTAVLCNGGSTGTITVTASGGTAGYESPLPHRVEQPVMIIQKMVVLIIK